MAVPTRVTVSSQIVLGRGVIDVISLDTTSQNSFADIYDGIYANGVTSGTHLWHIACPMNDYRDTACLSLPYKKGVFCMLAGTGAGIEISIR